MSVELARELADHDDPLRALEILEGIGDEGETLRRELQARIAHLESPTAFGEFYNEVSPYRSYFYEPYLAVLQEVMPRWAIVRTELLRQKPRSVLELGCFDGYCLLNLALTQGIPGVGVDVNAAAIAEATRRATAHNLPVHFLNGFIENFATDQDGVFDAVLILEVLEHVKDPEDVLRVAEQHLAPGGRVFVSSPLTAPNHVHERERREHVRLLDAPRMTALLTAKHRELVWYQRLKVDGVWTHCGAYTVIA